MRANSAELTKLGAFALLLTVVTSAIWSALLVTNLRTSPRVPWSALIMAAVLWIGWRYLSGRSGSHSRSPLRRNRLRARPVSRRTLAWALVAGLLSIASLAGLWIVLHQLIHTSNSTLPDFSRYSLPVVAVVVAMGALSGAVSEEAGFRGYFQGALESRFGAPVAIAMSALLILPAHGLTQGFAITTVLFYLCVDAMLGAIAYLTQSILPGIAVHFIGLVVFFTMVWPNDAARPFVATQGADRWFWIHLCQAIIGAAMSLIAFRRLRNLARPERDAREAMIAEAQPAVS